MSVILEIQDLLVQRGRRAVLEIEHLAIEENEVLAVIGPNGAGKSTLLLALSRLVKPERGQLSFRGQSISSWGDLAYRRRIGLVLQDPLLMDTSIFNNVAAGLRFRGLPRPLVTERVNTWLERLGIANLARRRAHSLSGGEAQRASLARALALDPDVLLLDEPFSALDAPTRASLLEDFQALIKSTAITTVFVTHDLDEALLLGSRVAVLLDGGLAQIGSPTEVFNAPLDAEVAHFVGVETVIPGKVTESTDGLVTIEAGNFYLEAVSEVLPGHAVYLCLRPEDITLWLDGEVPISSARNRLNGRVVKVTPQGPLVRVVLDCGFLLVALVTRSSAAEMRLGPGREVAASFKASAGHVITH
jgi:tungstate transport system ATP-binding protein